MCIYQPHAPRSESVSLLCCLEFGTKGNDEDMLKKLIQTPNCKCCHTQIEFHVLMH